MLSIYPDDLKFHFRYGMFLFKVTNNDNEGSERFKKALDIYFNKIAKNQDMRMTELQNFGENHESSIVVI